MSFDSDNFLNQISAISPENLSISLISKEIVKIAAMSIDSEAAALMLLDDTKSTLFFKASYGLNPYADGFVRIPKDKGVCWRSIRENKTIVTDNIYLMEGFYFVRETGEEGYPSAVITPLVYDKSVFGVLVARSRRTDILSSESVMKFEDLARRVSSTVKTALIYETNENMKNILSKQNELSATMMGIHDIDKLLLFVMQQTISIVGARSTAIWLNGDHGTDRKFQYYSGDGYREIKVDKGLENKLFDLINNKSDLIVIDNINETDEYRYLKSIIIQSAVIIALRFGSDTLGLFLIADHIGSRRPVNNVYSFSEYEINLLKSISEVASHSIYKLKINTELKKNLQDNIRNTRELSILFQISMATQHMIKLDTLLRVIISCVTVKSGLGFNRAIAFLLDEGKSVIKGMVGIGPSSAEEAGRIWSNLKDKSDDLVDFVSWLIKCDSSDIEKSEFNKKGRSLSFNLNGNNIISKSIRELRGYNIERADQLTVDDLIIVNTLENEKFAVVPLVTGDLAQGAILVDNHINRKPITDKDLSMLMRFASPASWAIGNIRLMEKISTVNAELIRLEEQVAHVERMTALGEIHAELAHEIKNPLMSIGGFARRLQKKSDNPEDVRRNVSIIIEEVNRLEELLTRTLEESKVLNDSSVSRVDINEVVEHSVDIYRGVIAEKGIKLILNLKNRPIIVNIDMNQLRQVIINMILNAIDALKCDKHPTIDKMITITTDYIDDPSPFAMITVADTAGGVEEEYKDKIFEPFFTTKKRGTGLGLALCRRIVRANYGTIDLSSGLGEGAIFKIKLPAD